MGILSAKSGEGKRVLKEKSVALRSLKQVSIFSPTFLDPKALEPGTVPWLLANYRVRLFPGWLLRGWRGEKRRGRDAWPATTLMTLLLLRWTMEGMSRLASVEQARKNVTWRAALGLEVGGPCPSEKTVRDFERFLREAHPEAGVPRYLLFHEHVVRLNLEEGLVGGSPIWTTDSTPMWCYGAVLDTVRLLGDGLLMLTREWAKARGTTIAEVASAWDVPHVMAPSTKGAFPVDWRDESAKAGVVTQLASKAVQAVEWVRNGIGTVKNSERKRLLRRCRHLMKVVSDDLEVDGQGHWVIAKRVAKDRLLSMTDPSARHGRKSQGRTFNGFKVHGLGEAVSGLIVSLTVTPGNAHDGSVCHRLIKRAKALVSELKEVLGDSAYGGAELRVGVRKCLGVELLTPALAIPETASPRFGRQDFAIDFQARSATCPAGVTTNDVSWVRSTEHDANCQKFCWPRETCNACPFKGRCTETTRAGRSLKLHPYEEELRRSREAWENPEVRQKYRRRTQCERLMHLMVRRGRRQARSFGLKMAHQQAHLIVAVNNLDLLAKRLALKEEARQSQAA